MTGRLLSVDSEILIVDSEILIVVLSLIIDFYSPKSTFQFRIDYYHNKSSFIAFISPKIKSKWPLLVQIVPLKQIWTNFYQTLISPIRLIYKKNEQKNRAHMNSKTEMNASFLPSKRGNKWIKMDIKFLFWCLHVKDIY